MFFKISPKISLQYASFVKSPKHTRLGLFANCSRINSRTNGLREQLSEAHTPGIIITARTRTADADAAAGTRTRTGTRTPQTRTVQQCSPTVQFNSAVVQLQPLSLDYAKLPMPSLGVFRCSPSRRQVYSPACIFILYEYEYPYLGILCLKIF